MNDIKEKVDEVLQSNNVSINEDTIQHYGVLGMKWGRRKAKYDNDDSGSNKKKHKIGSIKIETESNKNKNESGSNQKKNKSKEEDPNKTYNDNVQKQADRIGKTSDIARTSGDIMTGANKLNSIVSRNKNRNKVQVEMDAMDDKELRERVNRLELEQRYKNVTADRMSSGQQKVQNALAVGTSIATMTASALTVAKLFQELKKK